MTSKQLAAGVIIVALVVVAAGVLVLYKAPSATTTSSDVDDVDVLLQDLDSLVDFENQYSPSDMKDVTAE